MSDTLAGTEAYLETRYRERSAGERVEMACGMFSAAVQLARGGICASEPGLSEPELRIRLLRRLYGDELPREFLAAVSARLRSAVNVQ
ncbi:MAG: hypothetical protein Q7R30_01130 [Acidobacteriota bacterium]|nr:hypothetical protein [Acidobacteriota bacterium]